MKNLLLSLLLLLTFHTKAQLGGACIYMLPDSTVICYTTGNAGNPNIAACQSDAAAAGALPMDCLTSPFVNCASWYVSDGISCFFGGTGNCGGGNPCGLITLPIELVSFEGEEGELENRISWVTASEINNDYFLLKKDTQGIFNETSVIARINGFGNSTHTINYIYIDNNIEPTINYYKLIQVDYDGNMSSSKIIALDNRLNKPTLLRKINLLGQELTDEIYKYYSGIVIEQYTDGSSSKFMKY